MWQGTQCTEQARSRVGAKSSDALSRAKQCENQGADPGCEWAMWVDGEGRKDLWSEGMEV